VKAIKNGTPIYVEPYKEPKVWGVKGIGEYWYGAEKGEKSSVISGQGGKVRLCDVVAAAPGLVLGEKVVKKYGHFLPLTKILTPKGRLSMQFHDAKNELWVVTGIDKKSAGKTPSLIIGFNPRMIKKYGSGIKKEYRKALEEFGSDLNALIDGLEKSGYGKQLDKEKDVIKAAQKVKGKADIKRLLASLLVSKKKVESFYNVLKVKIGDVIPVPQGTLHALGAGIEIIEPQIAGPTQSLEDGATYPVRYYFPDYPRAGASKKLDLDRVGEMCSKIWKMEKPGVVKKTAYIKVERLPGGFEKKGMAVHRVTMSGRARTEYRDVKSYHVLVAVKGPAFVACGGKNYRIPQASADGKMLIMPVSCGSFDVYSEKGAQFLDIFTPVE